MTVTSRHGHDRKYEATPLELLFDLVFVLALLLLSHHLVDHLSWRGIGETVVMLLAIFTVWLQTSWAATLIRSEQSRTRWMVIAVMLLALFMNASVTKAFTTSGWAFVVPFLLIQVGRTVWSFLNSPDAVHRTQYLRVLVWLIATIPFWTAGAAVSTEMRLVWWAVAAGIDLVGTCLAHPLPGRRMHTENVPFEADHMLQRCRLFLLIALGETVLAMGFAIAAAPIMLMTWVTGTAALAGTVALWSLGFGRAARLTDRYVEETRDPLRTSLQAAIALLAMVAGLIAVAVANETVITHPYGDHSAIVSLLMYGGPILFMVGEGWYLWAVPKISARVHAAGTVAMIVVGFATLAAPSYVALILAGVTLSTVAVFERQLSFRAPGDTL